MNEKIPFMTYNYGDKCWTAYFLNSKDNKIYLSDGSVKLLYGYGSKIIIYHLLNNQYVSDIKFLEIE